MTSYCPVPGPVPTSPANRDYQAGFTAAMMLKDLKLAQEAANAAGAATPLGADAAALFRLYVGRGRAARFFRHHPFPPRRGVRLLSSRTASNASASRDPCITTLGARGATDPGLAALARDDN